jgi:hypothetical protein
MISKLKNPAIRRYLYRFLIVMGLYVVFLITAVRGFHVYHPTGWAAYLLAILPALPVIGVIVIVGLYLSEEKDEFQRAILVESMMWGIGATLSVTTAWGFLENFVPVPHFDLFLVFPLFWGVVGVAKGLLRLKYQ